MTDADETPLERARAKLAEIERQLRKHPDFQLYLITKSRKDRARMRRVMMEIPSFKLWTALTNSIKRAGRNSSLARVGGANAEDRAVGLSAMHA
jgi:hypothetical protein